MKRFDRVVDSIEKLQIGVGVFALFLIACIIPLQVFYRDVLRTDLMWSQDVTKALLVWIGFLGAAVLHKRKALIAVEFFLKYVPHPLDKLIMVILEVMLLLLILLIVIYGYRLNEIQMRMPLTLIEIPRAYSFSLPLLLNSGIMLLYSIHFLTKSLFFTPAPITGAKGASS